MSTLRRPLRHRLPVWLGMAALIVVGATAFGIPGRVGAASCATSPVGHVAEVIDFGDAPGAPAGIFSVCVPLTSGIRNGMQVLRAATRGGIGQDASGKVCQIMGVPAQFDPTNCSTPVNGKISYWAYFRGTGATWTYSGTGAAGVRVDPEIVEGWRFVVTDAGAQSAAPPPRNFVNGASSAWQSTCPPTPDTSTAAPAPGSGSGAPSGGASVPGVPATPAPGVQVGAGASSASSTAPGPSTTVTPRTGTTVPGEIAGLRSQRTATRLSRSQVRAQVAASKPEARPVAAILSGAAVVVVLGTAMVIGTRRSRRRRRNRLD